MGRINGGSGWRKNKQGEKGRKSGGGGEGIANRRAKREGGKDGIRNRDDKSNVLEYGWDREQREVLEGDFGYSDNVGNIGREKEIEKSEK